MVANDRFTFASVYCTNAKVLFQNGCFDFLNYTIQLLISVILCNDNVFVANVQSEYCLYWSTL